MLNSNKTNIARQQDGILSIRFAAAGTQLRRIVRKSNAKPTGKYPSFKTGQTLQWESTHERNAFKLLDACPLVRTFDAQYVEIQFILDGEVHSHFPDIFVDWNGGKTMIEVKTSKFSLELAVLKRTKFLTKALPEHGYEYRLIVAEDIAQEPRLSTISTLLDFGRAQMHPVDRERLRRVMQNRGSFCWGDVLNGVFGANGRNLISRLILEGELSIDFQRTLNQSSLVWRPESTGTSSQLPIP